MLIGVGTDILAISRVPVDASEVMEAFVAQTFTKREQDAVSKGPRPRERYAVKFAGKEAVFKAISALGCAFEPREIEILEAPGGRPFVTLHGRTRNAVMGKGPVTIQISLSYDGDYAIAFAAAQAEAGRMKNSEQQMDTRGQSGIDEHEDRHLRGQARALPQDVRP
jgi:holo-[acyl-carrier protein] synthase